MRLLQVAQRVEDLDRAATFYTALTGTRPAARFDPPGLVFFDLDGVRLLLDRATPSAMVYLEVDDIDAAIARAREAGANIETEPHAIFTHEDDSLGRRGTQEWQAFLNDSEGNTVGLVELRPV